MVAFLGVLAALALGVTAASGDIPGAPVSTDIPSLFGQPGVGKTLRTTNGSWSTSATFTYQWLRCVKGYRACSDLPGAPTYTVIPGATAQTYVPVRADVGHILVARVTATNAAGSASAMSSGKGLVEARPPGTKHKPWIRGTKKVGKWVTVTDARWTRSPFKFRQQWLRCSAKGNACVHINGTRKVCYSGGSCIHFGIGTSSSYKLTAKDVGHRIRVQAMAWNGAGLGTSISAPTRIVTR